jgi:hypothetical protein
VRVTYETTFNIGKTDTAADAKEAYKNKTKQERMEEAKERVEKVRKNAGLNWANMTLDSFADIKDPI